MNVKIWLTLIVAFYCCSQIRAELNGFQNPLRLPNGEMVHLADPFVFCHDSVYYMVGTRPLQNGFDCYRSFDLLQWEFYTQAYEKPAGHYGTGSFWAPEVAFRDGLFYMTYSAYHPDEKLLLSSLAVSENPEGPYRDLYAPWFNYGYSAIDCHIFTDTDDSSYLYFSKNYSEPGFSSGENYAVRLSDDFAHVIGEPVPVGKASQPWELTTSDRNVCNEGVFVFRHSDTYYMTYSANNTGYENYGVGYATADHPLGPWVKSDHNPILKSSGELVAPGHNSITTSLDGKQMYIVYHVHSDARAQKPHFDRVVCIDKLNVDCDGSLVVGAPSTMQAAGPICLSR